jgi:hypothetical protein
MVSAREQESSILGSLAARQNGGRRLKPGRDQVPTSAGLEVLPQPLKSRETSLHGVGCTIAIAPHEGGPSWRCVVELPKRMDGAAVIGDGRSRDEAVANAFRRAEVALGWTSPGAHLE